MLGCPVVRRSRSATMLSLLTLQFVRGRQESHAAAGQQFPMTCAIPLSRRRYANAGPIQLDSRRNLHIVGTLVGGSFDQFRSAGADFLPVVSLSQACRKMSPLLEFTTRALGLRY